MTRHGIGTTPNITKPCGTCGGERCGRCGWTGEIVVMKGGTPRIEDWPGVETVSGQGEKP